jgi:hypothetical protein
MSISSLAASALLAAFALTLGVCARAEDPLPPATNKLERFQLRHANCKWTNEMGNYIYECLKANFNMNAHWCHNEAMDAFCPKEGDQAKAAEAKPAEAAKPAN